MEEIKPLHLILPKNLVEVAKEEYSEAIERGELEIYEEKFL